ncbi:15307_t:CDS:2, partial [Cetraspora pellucida]
KEVGIDENISVFEKQLEDNKIPRDKHHINDKRLRKEAISEVEAH